MTHEPDQLALLRERRFAPFFATQFLGALNDNVFKQALLTLMTFHAARMTSIEANVLIPLAAGIFILPFFLFSASAGQLADKIEKTRIIRFVKAAEIVIMVIGSIGFLRSSLPILLLAMFLMGMHSTIFGPVKYAILPQHLSQHELVGGNAWVESGTFLAILVGTIAGGLLGASEAGTHLWVPVTTIGIAVLGYLTCRAIPVAPAAAPHLVIDWNPLRETWRNLKFLRERRTVFLSVLGVSWFWFYGALFLAQMPLFGKDVLGGDEHVSVALLTSFSVGIGIGSLLCERLSGHKVEIGLVPFGSIGLTLFALDLFFASPGAAVGGVTTLADFLRSPPSWRILFDLVMIGVFGGFYIVPLYALIQSRSDPTHQSRVIAGNNILNAIFMVVAYALAGILVKLGLSIPQLFLLTAILNALVAIYIYTLVPEFLMRFLAWLLIHSVYRVEKLGLDQVPEHGPAVVICNHVSFVDAVVIMAAVRRPIRFVMDHHIFRTPVLSFIFKTSKAIPIASAKESPATMERAFQLVREGLEAGDLIGLFPEGRITDTGELYPFRPGIRRILDATPVPVVPLALRGLWGSFFSRAGGPAMTKPFRRGLFSKIALVAGSPIPADQVTPEVLQARVSELRGDWK